MATNARNVGDLTRAVVTEIRAQRLNRDATQAQLADASGVPLSTLGKIERFESSLDVEQLARLAYAMEIEPNDLLRAALVRYHADATHGPLLTSRGSVASRSTDQEHDDIVRWAETHRPRSVRGSKAPSPDPESGANGDR